MWNSEQEQQAMLYFFPFCIPSSREKIKICFRHDTINMIKLVKKILLLTLLVCLSLHKERRSCEAFLTTSATSNRPSPLLPSFSSSSIKSTTSSNNHASSNLPIVQFKDPKTGCEVVLLGCFHGTASSSRDVQEVVTPETDLVALELCASRFSDLRQDQQIQQGKSGSATSSNGDQQKQKPWAVAYVDMISNTVQKRGLPTGLAAAVLAGVSGLQTAISGFTPGETIFWMIGIMNVFCSSC